MPRQRNYKAEYRARIARAKDLGLTKQQAAGHAKRAKLASVRQLQASGAIPKLPARRRNPKHTPLPQVAPGAATYHTTDARVIKGAVRDAQAAGQRVSFSFVIDTPSGPRTRSITGRGDGAGMVASAADTGEPAGDGGGDVRDRLRGKITVTVGPASMTGGGLDPGVVLDSWDAYDDIWDWFDDLADSEYG